jgi:hypothetical protein
MEINGKLHFLSFMIGLSLASALFAGLHDRYENRFFETLSGKVVKGSGPIPDDSIFVRSLKICHTLLAARSVIFAGSTGSSWIDKYVHPISTDLITAENACGSYSFVLVRILQELNYKVRVVQMRGATGLTCHILVEVESTRGWVVLDPLYDLYFIKPDGHLASFEDVSGNWAYYRSQVPPQYDTRYDYRGVSYTNWGKIPVLMPALKRVLSIFMNDKYLRHFSLRIYFLRKYRILKYIAWILFSFSFAGLIVRIIRDKRRPSPAYLERQQKIPPIYSDEIDWTRICG